MTTPCLDTNKANTGFKPNGVKCSPATPPQESVKYFNTQNVLDKSQSKNLANMVSDSTSTNRLIGGGSTYPIINLRINEDDVLIQNSGRKESYWVPKGVAAKAATAVALGKTSLSDEPAHNNGTEAIGAVKAFISNYQDMKDANTIGADKYFHCKANCEATKEGVTGGQVGKTISNAREWVDMNIKKDPELASEEDQKANHHGQREARNNPDKSCNDICAPFRPHSLDRKY